MRSFEEQRLEHFGEAIDAYMTADVQARGIIKPIYDVMLQKLGRPLSTFAAQGLVKALEKPNQVVFIGTGFLIRPTLNPETDGPIAAVLMARAVGLLGGIPVIVAEKECMGVLTVACRAGEMSLCKTLEEARVVPMSVLLVTMPPCGRKNEAETVIQRLLEIQPAAMVSIEHPGKADDGRYYSGLGYELTDWPGPVDDLLEKVREAGGFTVGIGDLGNEAGMGFARPEIHKLIPYGDHIVVKSTCDAPIIAVASEFGAYAVLAAMTFISGKQVLPAPELVEIVLRASVMSGAICGCGGAPTPSIDMIDISYIRSYVHMLQCVVEYSEKYSSSRPFYIDYRRGAPIAEPGGCKGGHAR